MTFVDTNVILRWILDDHPTLSQQAKRIISRAPESSLLITDVVLGEIVYILRQKKVNNQEIAETLTILLEQEAFIFDQESRLDLLFTIIAETKLDFADCYLISRAVYSGEHLATFDKAMQEAYNKYKTA